MTTILISYLTACLVATAVFIAVGTAWRKSKDRRAQANEANLEAALEGAMLRELEDHGFLRAGQ